MVTNVNLVFQNKVFSYGVAYSILYTCFNISSATNLDIWLEQQNRSQQYGSIVSSFTDDTGSERRGREYNILAS
jgi:hypothetical protein